MDQTAGNDLLDLHWETAAGGSGMAQQQPAPVANSAVAPAAPTASTHVEAPAAAPTAAAADDVDAEWDGFQSAVPATMAGAAAAAADAAKQGAGAAAPAAGGAATAEAAAADTVGSFDPMVSPKDKKQEPDPFSCLGETLDQKPGKGNDNLISFGALDEFDPVAQKWAKERTQADGVAAGPEAVDPLAGQAPAVAAAPPAAAAATAEPAKQPEPQPQAPVPAADAGGEGDLLGLGGAAPRPAPAAAPANAAGPTGEAEDIEKKVVFVYHKGEKNVVSWYADMKGADVKEAVLCACDAIIDGGFVLREVQFTGDDETTAEPKEDGRIFEFEQFDQLEHGQTYIIDPAKERDDLRTITGDRWRRLKVQIEPLLHVEANKAIDRMRRGSNLLKHTHYGFPHLRQFQLSDDRKRLVWYSGAKRKEDSVVQLDEVTEIRLGQTTPVFLHYRLPMLEHLSFSLVYGPKGSKTLDLTCKDEFEFDHWVTGLKAIFYHFKNRQISKEALLGHSKRFRKALEKNNVGIKLTKLPEVKEKGHVGLDDCIEIVTHTPQQLDQKMERLRERLKTMSQQVARLDHHSQAEMEVDLSLLTGQGPAYASVFMQDEDAQDEEMEIRRMHELVEQTTQILQQARNELIALNQRSKSESSTTGENAGAKGKKKENAACKHIDQLLWKAEVDLENVEDMYLRHIDNQKDTATPFSVSMADLNQRLSRAASDVEETFSKKVDEIKGWFSR
mmetsp:Transcript_150570/g.419643  ORF Transcript_150570/g.419643 Transcript_150570/m.419643 type:complete len:730 (-) Transcript_150570:242-2431(-)